MKTADGFRNPVADFPGFRRVIGAWLCRSLLTSVVLALVVSGEATSQIVQSRDFVISQFSMKEGLPQSSVNDMIQTKDRYIWLATYGGLVRFDGINFTTFDRFNTPGMSSDRVLNLYEARDGAIWMGTENGFLRFQDGKCTAFFIRQQSQVYSPLKVAEDSRGVLWITANAVLYRFTGSDFIQVVPITDPASQAMALSDRRGVWFGHDREVFRTVGDSAIRILDLKNQLTHRIQDFVEYPAGSGVYFLGTDGDGVLRLDGNGITRFAEGQGLSSPFFKKFYVDADQQLWAICYNGISRWTGSGFSQFTVSDGQRPYQFTSMLHGQEGNYWIGTPDNGFFRLKPAPIRTIDEQDGLKTTNMLSTVRLKNGSILISTNCGGIYEWRNGTIRYSEVNRFLPNLCVWSVLEDSRGHIWFGSRSIYRTHELDKPGEVINLERGYAGDEVFAMAEDRQGTIWIGCLNGLYRWDGKEFKRFTTADGLWYNDTRTIVQDRSDTLWIGTSAGLNFMVNGRPGRISLADPGQPEPYVRAIYRDSDGALWIGTYGNGLIRLKNGKKTMITTKNGLFDNIVSHVIPDSAGFFWMGSNRGLARVSIRNLNAFCEGETRHIFSSSYGTADGMRSAETNGGFQPSVTRMADGNLMVPTVHGLAVVRLDRVNSPSLAPPVFIESVNTGNNSFPTNAVVTLPADSAYLHIGYTAVSFSDPEKVVFRYRLEGLQEEWVEAGNNRTAIYSNIPPGDYTFQVIAANHSGQWNLTGDSVEISILPPFWQSWWFRFILITGFLFIGPSVYWWRVSALEREKRRQERFSTQLIDSQESERRRIAAELHDSLGQQILVIKNRADMVLRQPGVPADIAEQVQSIRDSAVSSIHDVRQISHALRPVHLEQFGLTESLNNLCEQLKETSGIEWSYYIDPVDGLIPPEKEINFYRIIQEATNNILKHAKATEASVVVRHRQGIILAKLWDDGVGFVVNSIQSTGGMGISGMTERVKTFPGGHFDIQSSPGTGTTIKLTIPV